MNIKIATCPCGTKVYCVPYVGFMKHCPSCKAKLTQDSAGVIWSDDKPCSSVGYSLAKLHYFAIEFPRIGDEIFAVMKDYSVQEITWGLIFSPERFDKNPLFRNYLCWLRR